MSKPFFVAIEGEDGSGKSTLVKNTAEILKSDGYKIETIAEPAVGFASYDLIQKYMLGEEFSKFDLAQMFALNRIHQRETLVASDQSVQIYLSDRSLLSSMVLQSDKGDKRLRMKRIARMNAKCLPDLLVCLYLPQSVRRARLLARDENNSIDTHNDLTSRYAKAANILREKHGVKVETIDANSTPLELALYTSLVIRRHYEGLGL